MSDEIRVRTSPCTFHFITDENGDGIGSVIERKTEWGAIEVFFLYVDVNHRGKGYGRKLMETVIARHPDAVLDLTAEPFVDKPMDKEQLIKFYESLGFEKYNATGRMVRNWDNLK